MRALKIFLMVMGLLIAAGFVFVGVEVYRRASDPGYRAAEAPPTVQPPELPAGARIGAMVEVANRVVFKATLPDGEDRLYILDPRTGTLTGAVRPAAAP